MNPTPMTQQTKTVESVTVGEGKYTVRVHPDGRMDALRYGEEWRELTGDGMVMALVHEIQSLRALLDHAERGTAAQAPRPADSKS